MTRKRNSDADGGAAPIIIKKYANRRLYNTVTSSYVTLDHLSQMVKEGVDFVVHDAKSGEDITRQVLTQIIVEEESKGTNLLPISFLRQLIGFYGDSLQGLVPQYLEMTMHSFTRNQEQIRQYLNDAFGGIYPFGRIEELSRQNLAMFQQAVDMFAPFGPAPKKTPDESSASGGEGENRAGGSGGERGAGETPELETSLNDLKAQLQAMQAQLDALTRNDD